MKSPRQLLVSFFDRRGTALTLCVLVVIASTLLNTRVKLGGRCESAAGSFYSGGYAGSETEESLGSLLSGILSSAEQVESVAGHYGIDCSASDAAGEALKTELKGSRGAVGGLRTKYDAFCLALDGLISQLEGTNMNERDAESFRQGCEAIKADEQAIEASGYNDYIKSFLRSFDRFPTNMLAGLAGVEFPELFA